MRTTQKPNLIMMQRGPENRKLAEFGGRGKGREGNLMVEFGVDEITVLGVSK